MRTSGIIVAFPFYRFRSYDSCCTHSTQKKMQSFFHTIFFFTLRNICTPAAKFCIVLHSIKKDGSVYCLSTCIQVVPLSLSAHRFPLPQPYLTFQRKNIKKWASILLCHPYFGCKKKKKKDNKRKIKTYPDQDTKLKKKANKRTVG